MPIRASSTTSVTQEQIASIAYEIYESEGRPVGRADEHWRMAQSLLNNESNGNRKRAARSPVARRESVRR